MSDLRSYGQPMTHSEFKFCKFCGVHTDTPCVDETDLNIYSRTVDRCADAKFNLVEGLPLPPQMCSPDEAGK